MTYIIVQVCMKHRLKLKNSYLILHNGQSCFYHQRYWDQHIWPGCPIWVTFRLSFLSSRVTFRLPYFSDQVALLYFEQHSAIHVALFERHLGWPFCETFRLPKLKDILGCPFWVIFELPFSNDKQVSFLENTCQLMSTMFLNILFITLEWIHFLFTLHTVNIQDNTHL